MMTTATLKMPVFFDLDKLETIAEEEAAITLDYTPPIILPEDTLLEENDFLTAHEPTPVILPHIEQTASSRLVTSPWLWLFGSLGLLFSLMLLIEAYYLVVQQYDNSFFFGTLFLGLILTAITAIATLSWRAYQDIQALRIVSTLQKEGQKIMANDGYGSAIYYLNKVAQLYAHNPEIKTRLERFYLTLNDSHHDRELCLLFSSYMMKDIDQQACRIVTQRSQETALLVMISQMAWLDSLLTLWRNIRMIRDVATLYGGRPGFLGSISLISVVLQNLIYAGASEVVADGVAEMLGSSVLSVMSAQAAQGLGSGILTARLGLHAIQACRPLPFSEDEKPRLKDIRKVIVSSLKGVFEAKKTAK